MAPSGPHEATRRQLLRFEGHITSEIIKRVLSERPKDLVGLSIPGMPSGVPGMEARRTAQ